MGLLARCAIVRNPVWALRVVPCAPPGTWEPELDSGAVWIYRQCLKLEKRDVPVVPESSQAEDPRSWPSLALSAFVSGQAGTLAYSLQLSRHQSLPLFVTVALYLRLQAFRWTQNVGVLLGLGQKSILGVVPPRWDNPSD